MALHDIVATLPWPVLIALFSIATIYGVYRRRTDLFEQFGFGTREVTFLTLLPVAGWAVNFPLVVLGRSTLALNLGGAIVPILLSGWIVHRGYLRREAVLVTVVAVAVTAVVSFEIVRFEPQLGIIAEFPWFFLPSMAASGVTLLLLARKDLMSVPAAYIAGTLGALIGADLFHLGEIGPYMLASTQRSVLSVGGAGALDMVFLAGVLAMAFNLIAVALVNPPRPERLASPAPAFRYPSGLELVHDPERFVVLADKHRVAGRYTPPRDRARYHLARADLALEDDDPAGAVEEARNAVRVALDHARGTGVVDEARSNADFERDLQALLDETRTGPESAEEALTSAKLIVRALHREVE